MQISPLIFSTRTLVASVLALATIGYGSPSVSAEDPSVDPSHGAQGTENANGSPSMADQIMAMQNRIQQLEMTNQVQAGTSSGTVAPASQSDMGSGARPDPNGMAGMKPAAAAAAMSPDPGPKGDADTANRLVALRAKIQHLQTLMQQQAGSSAGAVPVAGHKDMGADPAMGSTAPMSPAQGQAMKPGSSQGSLKGDEMAMMDQMMAMMDGMMDKMPKKDGMSKMGKMGGMAKMNKAPMADSMPASGSPPSPAPSDMKMGDMSKDPMKPPMGRMKPMPAGMKGSMGSGSMPPADAEAGAPMGDSSMSDMDQAKMAGMMDKMMMMMDKLMNMGDMPSASVKAAMAPSGGMESMELAAQMGIMPGFSGSGMAMASEKPGNPGASHLYHVGATDFFMDQDAIVTLSADQQKLLNRFKEEAALDLASTNRAVQESEQELWTLTSADPPENFKIEAKVADIEKLKGDARLRFIASVQRASKVLTLEQQEALTGSTAAAPAMTPASPSPKSTMPAQAAPAQAAPAQAAPAQAAPANAPAMAPMPGMPAR